MKKMLLLFVSGLLIACMAGSAIASNTVVSTDEVSITPDGQTISDVGVSVKLTSAANTYRTTVTASDGLSAYLQSSSPIAVGDSSTWASSGSLSGNPFTIPSAPTTYSGTLHIKGTKPGTVTVTTYYSGGSDQQVYSVYSGESVDVSVPEFPTVALPVAAMLGLVFVFGRKKEGL